MRLVIQARMVSVEGKSSEHKKITKAVSLLSDRMYNTMGLVDNTDQNENLSDISFTYDQYDFTIEQIKKLYNQIKKGL